MSHPAVWLLGEEYNHLLVFSKKTIPIRSEIASLTLSFPNESRDLVSVSSLLGRLMVRLTCQLMVCLTYKDNVYAGLVSKKEARTCFIESNQANISQNGTTQDMVITSSSHTLVKKLKRELSASLSKVFIYQEQSNLRMVLDTSRQFNILVSSSNKYRYIYIKHILLWFLFIV